jgi:nucleotide-binding universal stress UspA family protein
MQNVQNIFPERTAMKILVAVDGSENSLRALDFVLGHSSMFGQLPDITVINAHHPVPSPRARSFLGKDVLTQYYHEEAEAALAPVREAATKRGVTLQEVVVVGEPGSEIAKAAGAGAFQMIVLGTHGRTALGNLVMGSVATRVIAESTVPVLLVK